MDMSRFYFGMALVLLNIFTVRAADNSQAEMLAGQRIMVLGDSVTQQGDYLDFIEYYLRKQISGKEFDIINIGLSGETVSGLSEEAHPFKRPCLHERLTRAFAKIKPSIVVACYGMNDGIYHPESEERSEAFREGIKKIIWKTRQNKARLILLTPPVFDAKKFTGRLLARESSGFGYNKPYIGYDLVLQSFSHWIMLLDDPNLVTIDIHQPMVDYLRVAREKDPQAGISKDGVHPDKVGHLIMADTFLKSFGMDTGVESLARQLKLIEDDPMYELIVKRNRVRSKGWLEYVGYTAARVVQTDSIEKTVHESSQMEFRIDQFQGIGPAQ